MQVLKFSKQVPVGWTSSKNVMMSGKSAIIGDIDYNFWRESIPKKILETSEKHIHQRDF